MGKVWHVPCGRLTQTEFFLNIMGEIKVSPDYNWFRSTVPLKKIIVDDDDSKVWSLYDAGPRSIRCPLIFLPPVSGTADVFFQQILALTGWGYRVIAYPVYWDHLEFCDGFRKLLDHLQLDKVHLFGASLGGFLAQKFAEYTHKSPRVQSLILCNAFSDTSIFNQTWTANSFWLMPAFMLKKIVLGNFASGPLDPEMADGIDFMVDRLESLGQSELASRLTLNCQNSYVEPHKIRDIPVTIMDVFDQSALSTEAKEEMYKLYPNARRAHLKTGGNFPYLCRSAEVNLYIQIHLLQFHGTRYAAIDPSMVSAEELEVQKISLHTSNEQDEHDHTVEPDEQHSVAMFPRCGVRSAASAEGGRKDYTSEKDKCEAGRTEHYQEEPWDCLMETSDKIPHETGSHFKHKEQELQSYIIWNVKVTLCTDEELHHVWEVLQDCD
ncbi:Maspardin, partial [Lamprotornis superbus]